MPLRSYRVVVALGMSTQPPLLVNVQTPEQETENLVLHPVRVRRVFPFTPLTLSRYPTHT
jgi:hypothetical protein